VREVTVPPQLGDGRFNVVAVTVIDSLVADLAVFGIAESICFRGPERISERLQHRSQQIGTRRYKGLFREGMQGQTVGCGHRADLRAFNNSKISRWPFLYPGAHYNIGAKSPNQVKASTPLLRRNRGAASFREIGEGLRRRLGTFYKAKRQVEADKSGCTPERVVTAL
jgi:hypothetical protein